MNKAYNRTYWENKPSDKSPINERNLNNIEVGVDEIDNRVLALDTTKFDKVEAQGLFKDVSLNRANGVITFTMYNGATKTIDTLLEKIAVNFDYDPATQRLIITLDDGEVKYIDLSALITQYEFLDSDTVDFQIQADGKVTAAVKEGSIQEKHLRPDYLADIKVEAAKAQASQQAAAASEQAAAESAANAAASEQNAAASEAAAAVSAGIASDSAVAAKASEDVAKISEENARASEEAAGVSEQNAATSAREASVSATGAADSAKAAEESAGHSKSFANMSQSYAIGTQGIVRPSDASDNSKFYSDLAKGLTEEAHKLLEQTQKIIASASQGALIPAGTITFSDLPESPKTGYMYNISDDFITDIRFEDGAGIFYRAGSNVYWTVGKKWDVLTGMQVTGVKGNNEPEYRAGNVNLTSENIGLGNVGNYKAVSTSASQGLSAAERENARNNIGAGTSSFSGNYNDLSNKPGNMSGATASVAGKDGLVPAPGAGAQGKYLKGDGTWQNVDDHAAVYSSGDAPKPSTWTDIAVMQSGETHKSIFGKISTMLKNVRYMWKMLGTTNISAIGDGTVTGAINALNLDVEGISYPYGELNNILLRGIISKPQNDVTGSSNRNIIFIPAISNPRMGYGVKAITAIIVQGIAILRKDGKDVGGYQIVEALQTYQGIFLSLVINSGASELSGYICDCTFDFYRANNT